MNILSIHKRPARLVHLGLALILLAKLVGSATAAPGDLDTGFGTNGVETTSISAFDARGQAVAIQSDGKIVVAGFAGSVASDDFALARYNSDGSLDSAFDGDGKLETSFSSGSDRAFSVAIQSDGKIVAVGHAGSTSDKDFASARYSSDGSLDNSFGSNGLQTTGFGQYDYGRAVVIQPDGKIVVAGYTDQNGTEDIALARYNDDGSLDTGFGSNGRVTTPIGSGSDRAFAVTIQADGKIVVAGQTFSGSGDNFAVARYTSAGALDNTFDGDGIAITALSNHDAAYGVAIQPDGKILVVGTTDNGSGDGDFTVLRYEANGSLDTSFGTSGVTTTHFDSYDAAESVALQSDGKIVVAGYAFNGSEGDFTLARYNTDGSLDATFSGDGKALAPLVSGDNRAYGVAIQSDGKIVVAGEAQTGSNYDFVVARFEGGNAPTAVTLVGFSVNQEPGKVRVNWQTAQEIDLLGFNLYRSSGPGGTRQRLNQTLIAAQGMGGLAGEAYEFADTGLQSGQVYVYWLEIVYQDGSEAFGSIPVVGNYWVYAPLVVR